MRVAYMIICLTAIALSLVAMRAEEVAVQQDIQRLQLRMVDQRRRLWQLDAALGELRAVVAVNVRAEEMNLSLLAPGASAPPLNGQENFALSGAYGLNGPSAAESSRPQFWRPSGGGG